MYLHEEAGDQCAAYIDVIITAGELCATPWQVETVHDA